MKLFIYFYYLILKLYFYDNSIEIKFMGIGDWGLGIGGWGVGGLAENPSPKTQDP
jgi:hypothetical protein